MITTDSGEQVEALAPIIISASRSTDIPAFSFCQFPVDILFKHPYLHSFPFLKSMFLEQAADIILDTVLIVAIFLIKIFCVSKSRIYLWNTETFK